jgi:hypothetical protein
MTEVTIQSDSSDSAEAIEQLEQAISGGQHWYIALLEAIGRWTQNEETINGRHYQYLIEGQAFDWLLLAERLCQAVDGLLPEGEKIALLFHGQPPIKLSNSKFKQLISGTKYRQYLNYFYGVTVEEALLLAVQDEVRKEKRTLGYHKEHNLTDEVYQRIYGAARAALLNRFRREKGYPRLRSISLTELKEFSYWLFHYRLKHCDKARMASDTKKALERLGANGFARWLATAEPEL